MTEKNITMLKKNIDILFESELIEINSQSYNNAVILMKIYFGLSEVMFRYCPDNLTRTEINCIRQFISVRYCALCEMMRIKYHNAKTGDLND